MKLLPCRPTRAMVRHRCHRVLWRAGGPEEGETPVAGIFFKERCHKMLDEKTKVSLATRHLRKAGQNQIDQRSGRETTGQFESAVRQANLSPQNSAAPNGFSLPRF